MKLSKKGVTAVTITAAAVAGLAAAVRYRDEIGAGWKEMRKRVRDSDLARDLRESAKQFKEVVANGGIPRPR